MTPKRVSILKRAARGLGATLISAGILAAGSPDFREFVGNEALWPIVAAVTPASLLALDKWWRSRRWLG